METYRLNTLILFFKSQQDKCYVAIDEILWVIDTDEIPEKDKREMIIYILREAGLNEVTFKGGGFIIPTNDELDKMFDKKPTKASTTPILAFESVELKLMNGIVKMGITLN